MNIENQLIDFIASSLATADTAFVDDFVSNGPIPGGVDGANRYLLAVAMRDVAAPEFAISTGVSQDVAESLLAWLKAGTRGV
ncbi:hypothetical protein ACYSUW_15095 [Pseudomonas frederiksbergensis]